MVKFSKELEAQLIPEWKEAFVNYWQLKKQVKKIRLSRRSTHKQMPHHRHHQQEDVSNWDLGPSIFDPLRAGFTKISARFMSRDDDRTHSIQAKSRRMSMEEEQREGKDLQEEEDKEEGEDEDDNGGEGGQLLCEEDETKVFFEMVEAEVKKVNQFYRSREREFLERGESLDKQLRILMDLKQLHSARCRKSEAGALSLSLSSPPASCCPEGSDRSNGKTAAPAAAAAAHPLTAVLWEELVSNPKRKCGGEVVRPKKVQSAEKMIRGAYVELYRGLGLLKTYSSLNMLALTKILKKFDKVSNQHVSARYLKALKRSHFFCSDEVGRAMDEVESKFTKHFANSDRKKTMQFLRPHRPKQDPRLPFLVGLFTGCFVTLFITYAILAHLSGIFSQKTPAEAAYLDTVYPVFSMFALLSLHVFIYGCNMWMWKTTHINYNFIFEFFPTGATARLKYSDAFLMCTASMTATVGAMVVHLLLRDSRVLSPQVDAIPGILLLIFSLLLVCPLNILYRATRYRFLQVLRNIMCSPFYRVLMVDFFMADQLTSQVPLLRHMESTACYLLAGSFKTHQFETCKSRKLYMELAYVISFLPYYWRAMQCVRRWLDECDVNHLANLGKYVSAMVAAGARLTYARQQDNLWMVTVIITSVITTAYQLYWDFVKDWGLLNPNSKNPWLRDDLILNNRGIYYISIVLNLVLRVTWVETVMRFNMGMFESRLVDFVLASLEVIRRGMWNFFRLENEHLNNVGKFRAVKMSPLPFRDTDSDG